MTLALLRQPFRTWFDRLAQPAEAAPLDYPFAPSDVARLHALDAHEPGESLDDQTWRDLLLERHAAALAPQTSIFGRQWLYRRLRAGTPDSEVAAQRARVERLLAAPAQLDALQRTLRPLRDAEVEVAGVLFDDAAAPPPAQPSLVARARGRAG